MDNTLKISPPPLHSITFSLQSSILQSVVEIYPCQCTVPIALDIVICNPFFITCYDIFKTYDQPNKTL